MSLNKSQLEAVGLLSGGKSVIEVAEHLKINPDTINGWIGLKMFQIHLRFCGLIVDWAGTIKQYDSEDKLVSEYLFDNHYSQLTIGAYVSDALPFHAMALWKDNHLYKVEVLPVDFQGRYESNLINCFRRLNENDKRLNKDNVATQPSKQAIINYGGTKPEYLENFVNELKTDGYIVQSSKMGEPLAKHTEQYDTINTECFYHFSSAMIKRNWTLSEAAFNVIGQVYMDFKIINEKQKIILEVENENGHNHIGLLAASYGYYPHRVQSYPMTQSILESLKQNQSLKDLQINEFDSDIRKIQKIAENWKKIM